MSDDIWIKKDSIVEAEYKNTLKISWSKLNQYGNCPASWFCINYADIINVECVQINQTKAIPGTIVQKLFETFINKRIYTRPNMETFDDLVDWFKVNSKALFKLIARPLKDQYLFKYKNPRFYFKRNAGRGDLDRVRSTHNLDIQIKSPQIAFINWESLDDDFGSPGVSGEEGFLNHLESLYGPILELFVEKDINLNYMLSEVYIQSKLNNIVLNGYIDFIYNKNQGAGTFFDISQLSEGFLVLDGKIRMTKYVSKEQLYYYATLLYLKYGKRPSFIGFIDWSKPRFPIFDFDFDYLNVLKSKVAKIRDSYYNIKNFLGKCKDKQILLEDIGLKYNSSPGCIYCPIVEVCKPALERREELERFATAIENKKKTKKYLREMGVEDSKSTQNIKL